jgi:4-amino-4-deoxy-L-arabinose transferase-like glycosyltransferase
LEAGMMQNFLSFSGKEDAIINKIIRITPFNLIMILWLIVGITSIYLIPVAPHDELCYLGIAWNMFKAHNWLLTFSMADLRQVDLEKTPLLYWFILAGWKLFGVNETWPKVLILLLGTANICLTYVLARKIFPENVRIAWLSSAVLLCNFFWPNYFGSTIRFEGLITFFGLLFLLCMLTYLRDKTIWSLNLAGLTLGLCLFSKGGVGFIYYLPLTILMPYLLNRAWHIRWLLPVMAVVGAALIPSVLYLIYIYFTLGYSDLHYLLFGQISQRVSLKFNIVDAVALTLCFSPLMLFFRFRKFRLDKRVLILTLQILFTFLFFSLAVLFRSKRYFLPVCPLMALVIAWFVDQFYSRDRPIMLFAILFSCLLTLMNITAHFGKRTYFYENVALLAAEVKSLQLAGYPVAIFGTKLMSPFLDFLGRLPKDLPIIGRQEDQAQWLSAHPHGYIIGLCEKNVNHLRHCYQIKKDALIQSVWSDKSPEYCLKVLGHSFGACGER